MTRLKRVFYAVLAKFIDIDALLAARRQIGIIWVISDVQHVRPDLTDDQAWEVLQQVNREYDAHNGINWDVIEFAAGWMFAAPDGEDENDGAEAA